jgi:TonB family protein
MTACLRISDFQGYLEGERSGATVEVHLVICEKCRAAFDRIATTHKRVNSWLAALASPMDDEPVDVAWALARVRRPDVLSTWSDAEVPWYLSLYRNVYEIVRPQKLPPLNVTSRPVAVKEIWGLYEKDPKSRYMSMAIHAAVFALLMVGATNTTVRKSIQDRLSLVDPNVKPYVPEKAQGGGGGGARQPLPASKGAPPASKQFVSPPMIVTERPKLAIDPSVDAPVVPSAAPLGDLLGRLVNGSNGPGFGGGMGSGKGGGIGPGSGGGVGPGEGGGAGGGVFRVGGGVSAPVVIAKVDPEYSEEARKAKFSGAVLLSIVVDTEGRARDIHVTKSLGMGLDEKAIEAVEKWKFKPGMRAGVAVNVRATIEVNFRLL